MLQRFSKTLQSLQSKPLLVTGIALFLFLPVLFIGTHSSHDWGDDFAQYIHQAGNITQGIPQSETGFVYSQENYIGPQAYPVGFPLLLAPVYALAGNNMFAFTTFISAIYILLGLLLLLFYKEYFSHIPAFLLAFIFVYNPQMIIFKREVMSDIPFTAILVLNFILYSKARNGSLKSIAFLIIFTGFLLVVRPAGIVFVAALITDQFILFVKRNQSFKYFSLKAGSIAVIPVLLYFFVNSFVFNIPSGGSISDYLKFYYSGDIFGIIPSNFAHHLEVFRFMYTPETGPFKGFSLILGSVMITLVAAGFIKRILQGFGAIDWFFVFYIAMLLIFPNNYSAFRLMVPLGFLFLFYAANGLRAIQIFQNVTTNRKASLAALIVLAMFAPGLLNIMRTGDHELDGPQQKSATEAFSFVSKNVSHNSVVVFAKPRALALYAGCSSMADPFTTDPTSIHTQVMQGKANYLLIHNSLTSEAMKRYSRVMMKRLTREWSNKEFILYKIGPATPSANQ